MTVQPTPMQLELRHILQQTLHLNEQVHWTGYPDRSRRAKRVAGRSLVSSWRLIRLLVFLGILIMLYSSSLVYHTDLFLPLSYTGIFLFAFIVGLAFVFLRRQILLKRLDRTIYAITSMRVLVITQDRGQFSQNSYDPIDLGRIDFVERPDHWGDIAFAGQQRVQSTGISLLVSTPGFTGIAEVRRVVEMLLRLKSS